jgi:hypothetical protein
LPERIRLLKQQVEAKIPDRGIAVLSTQSPVVDRPPVENGDVKHACPQRQEKLQRGSTGARAFPSSFLAVLSRFYYYQSFQLVVAFFS